MSLIGHRIPAFKWSMQTWFLVIRVIAGIGLGCLYPAAFSQSYHYYMGERLFDHIDVSKNSIHIPDGNAPDLREECLNYENAIKTAGGVDLQILGTGSNGHIGFNEPIGSLSSGTWIKILAQNTVQDNARFFEDLE